jgi:peptidoglycan/xylan/chitin deacetylase (PgdA/CDA1 family)
MKGWFYLLIILSGCNLVNSNETINSTLIVLTFDDGSKTIYDLALPIMQKYNYPGVNFIPTGWIDKEDWMTLDQVRGLEKNGWETGGHTVHHANLTTIPIDSARSEIRNNYEQLITYGLKHRCFALPGGHSNEETTRIIKQYFSIIRTSQNERYKYPLNLDRLGYYQAQNNDDANSLLMRIAHGINQGECLIIFGFHQFTRGEDVAITRIKLSVFKDFIEGIHNRNLQVVTLSEAVDRLHQ